jgi:hypothetical protein
MSSGDANTGVSWGCEGSIGARGCSGRTSEGRDETLRSDHGCPTSQEGRRASPFVETYSRSS